MCHSDSSRPPAARDGLSALASGPLVLEASDGNRLLAYAARSRRPTGAGVVVLPDVRGLHAFYRDLTERFAEIGLDAVAVDYFGRTAETDERDATFPFREHADQTTVAGVTADAAAAAGYLRGPDGGAVTRVFTVGFCFGGGHSWRLAADLPGLSGAVGFYGRPALASRVLGRPHAPLLLLASGADAQIPVADVQDFAELVRASGGQAELAVYDGVPHSFFDRSGPEHQRACDQAWERLRAFIANSTS